MKYKVILSVKLTAIFTLLIFVSVLVFSILVLNFTQRLLEKQQTEELLYFLGIVEDGYRKDVQKEMSFPSHSIPYYILYRISNEDGTLIRTNDAFVPVLPDTEGEKSSTEFREDFFIDGDLNLRYVAKTVAASNGKGYRVQVAVDLRQDNVHLILKGLPRMVLLFSIPLLLVSSIVAFLVSKRILHPLRKIILQAQEITSEKLDSRLDESGAKDELQELAATFNQLFGRLQEDFERQRRFTADAAHELKTPLAVISGHVDLLCRWGKDNPQVLEESLQMLQKESRSMASLIESLLQLTRAENNDGSAYPKEEIQLFDFLQEVLADFTLIYPDGEFHLNCPKDSTVFCNQEALKQILRIFVKNSLTYSDKPTYVEIGWNQETSRLWVKDRGWGIEEKHLSRIFHRFYRVDEARNRNNGGTGLGLPIARALTEKLGLDLEVQSLVGHGTTMILNFPH